VNVPNHRIPAERSDELQCPVHQHDAGGNVGQAVVHIGLDEFAGLPVGETNGRFFEHRLGVVDSQQPDFTALQYIIDQLERRSRGTSQVDHRASILGKAPGQLRHHALEFAV
jgi:hypothetical protein